MQKVGITESDRLDGLVGTYVEINPVVVPRFNWMALDGSPEGDRVQGHESLCMREIMITSGDSVVIEDMTS